VATLRAVTLVAIAAVGLVGCASGRTWVIENRDAQPHIVRVNLPAGPRWYRIDPGTASRVLQDGGTEYLTIDQFRADCTLMGNAGGSRGQFTLTFNADGSVGVSDSISGELKLVAPTATNPCPAG